MNKRLAVIGGGIAGLAAAYEATRHARCELTLFEASGRLGGTVETVRYTSAAGQYVVECGPDSWVSEKPWARELAVELGLGDELIYSNDAVRRTYLAQGPRGARRLVPMPDGMRMMVPTRWEPVLESPLFSEAARRAYLDEPGRAEELKATALANNPDADESVAEFVRRHFGHEATETIAGPLLAGVFGGDVETLSARATLAPFVRMEKEHGSLVTAVMARAKAEPAAPIFTTLRSGLNTLVDRMAEALPAGSVRMRTPVRAVQASGKSWIVATDADEDEDAFDGVVLATPAHVTRELLLPLDEEAAGLHRMEATSAIVVALLFDPDSRVELPRGFGFLVPPGGAASGGEPMLLAGTFMNQKFPGRAPDGAVLLRGFFGGHAAPGMMSWSDPKIVEATRQCFAELLGPLPSHTFSVVRRWPHSLPQYGVGHFGRMARLEGRLGTLPGLRLVGNAYYAVGLPDLVHAGRCAARSLLC